MRMNLSYIVHPRIIHFSLFGPDFTYKSFITATLSIFYPVSFLPALCNQSISALCLGSYIHDTL